MKRKPLSKKTRFEVFKRDGFKCQYCGAAAPDATLVVDHINPVAEGGSNEIMNLITACQACNAGKGKRELSDRSVLQKQRAQLDALHERRTQLEMMAQWRDAMQRDIDIQVGEFAKAVTRKGFDRTAVDYRVVEKVIKRFGITECLEAFDIAVEQYGTMAAVMRHIEGIAFIRRKEREDPYYSTAALMVNSMKKRGITVQYWRAAFSVVYQLLEDGTPEWAIWKAMQRIYSADDLQRATEAVLSE